MNFCRTFSGLNTAPRAPGAALLPTNSGRVAEANIHTQVVGPDRDGMTLHARAWQFDTDLQLAQVPRFPAGGGLPSLGMIAARHAAQYRDRVLQIAAGIRPR